MVKGSQDKMQYALYNQIIKNQEVMEKLEEVLLNYSNFSHPISLWSETE